MLLKGRQEKLITGLSEGMLILSILAKVEGSAEGQMDCSSLETLLVIHPLLGVGVPIREAIRAPGIQP